MESNVGCVDAAEDEVGVEPPTLQGRSSLPLHSGFDHVWQEKRRQRMDLSRRATQAMRQGAVRLADLWDWEPERWKSPRQLRQDFGLPRGFAQTLASAVAADLEEEVLAAMNSPSVVSRGDWVAEECIYSSDPHWRDMRALQVENVSDDLAEVTFFSVGSGAMHETDEGATFHGLLEVAGSPGRMLGLTTEADNADAAPAP